MTALVLTQPRPWATNTNYSTGPDAGTETKTDPASDANGFIDDVIAAPQHVNYLFAQLSLVARQAMSRACILRYSGITTDDTNGFMAALSQGKTLPAVVGCVNTNGTPLVQDGGVPFEAGAVASITAAVFGAAYNPSVPRLVLVGSGGNRCCFSDDAGASWSAGANLGGTGRALIWNPTWLRFMALYADHARWSVDAAGSWTDVTVTGAGSSTTYGLAMLSNGDVVTPTNTTGPTLAISQNGGTSWAATSGVPTFTGGTGAISVAGEGFSKIYCARAATVGGSTGVVVASSSDGNTWTTVASIDYLTTFGANVSNALIKQCPDTGVLFLCANLTNGLAFSASLDGGVTWSVPVKFGSGLDTNTGVSATGWTAVGGRIVAVDKQGNLLVSDGFGVEQLYA